MHTDVLVIGGGPAGLAAALAASANGAKVTVLERDSDLGGILQQCIHNGFGLHYFGEELTGPEYAQRFIDRLHNSGIEVLCDTMVIDLTAERQVTAVSAERGLLHFTAGAVVLAMGCRERTRGALNIPGFRPAGIYTAGSAQRLVNMQGALPGREVVVLGSGDIGLIMARRLTWEGAKVKLVCELMPYSSGLARNVAQCLVDNDIPLKFSHTVVRIHGKERVEGVTVAAVNERLQPIKSTEEYIPCDTLLLSVGLIPENELSLMAGVPMDPVTGGAIVDQHRQTGVPGVFACGNVLQVHDLVDNVSREAEIAGAAAARYAQGGEAAAEPRWLAVTPGDGVRYVVPQRIDLNTLEPGELDLYFRVRNVVKPATAQAKLDGTVLKQRRAMVMTPGEMEKITIDTAKLTQDSRELLVSVTGGQA